MPVLHYRHSVKVESTDQFSVEEKGKVLLVFTITQADSFNVTTIGDVMLVNSKGEEKFVRKNIKGIALKDVLKKISLTVDKPKELNQYVFLLEATDGYKAALSRNEIFNTNNLYLVTEASGIAIKQSPDRI